MVAVDLDGGNALVHGVPLLVVPLDEPRERGLAAGHQGQAERGQREVDGTATTGN